MCLEWNMSEFITIGLSYWCSLPHSNLNPNCASDSSPLRNEGWWTSGGKSLWVHPFSLSSFFSSWMCFNISCSNSYWNSSGSRSFSLNLFPFFPSNNFLYFLSSIIILNLNITLIFNKSLIEIGSIENYLCLIISTIFCLYQSSCQLWH